MFRIEWADGSITSDLEDKDHAVHLVDIHYPTATFFEWEDDESGLPVRGYWATEADLNGSGYGLALVRENQEGDQPEISHYAELMGRFHDGVRTADTLPPPESMPPRE